MVEFTDSPQARYQQKKQRLIDELRRADGVVRLEKNTSNLFRDRNEPPRNRLDVRDFDQVLEVNADEGWVEVEGMTPYVDLVDATLPRGVMPCVVPELKSITIGGATTGIGIESSSFKYGLVHETVQEMEILTGDGAVVTATPNNNHRDLFYAIPNAYGTLGYVLKLRAKVIPVKPYVELRHYRHTDPERYFRDLDEKRAGADFLDGAVFGPHEMTVTVGRFTDHAPYTSDYTYENIYYQSLRRRDEDYLTVRDYIWRWDTDWFWCSRALGAQNPVVRRLLGRKRLNSIFYTKVMRWNSRWGLTRRLDRLLGRQPESVIQDVDIPIDRAPEFFRFFIDEIGILPFWTCPFRNIDPAARYPLFATDPDTYYINFGFWDVVHSKQGHEPGHFNRLIERKVRELGGIKSLYSDSYFPEDEFWAIYDKTAYDGLKARYDPDGRFKNLYQKTVLRA